MELVEGPTLADRISQGAIPVDEAVAIAKQIAEALEEAHEHGIIHRDLKPANVKVREDGTVKVLDFGLAKALEPAGAGSPDVSHSPTMSARATQAGVILGTAAYMSPEQARGKPVDKRADVWSFGVVLYEMLTGKRAFEGEDVSVTLADVIRAEPAWDALPQALSPSLVMYLKRCLHKEPKQRVHDIADVRLALEGAFETDAASVASPPSRWWSQPRWVAGVALGVLAGLGTGWAVWVAGRADADSPVRRVQLAVPASVDFPSGGGTMVGLSPDGQTVVYRGADGGVAHLYQRRLDQLEATIIPGTEDAIGSSAFFSPDSQSLTFVVSTSLMRVALAGGSPTRIADLPGGPPLGGSWGLDDTIIVGLRGRGLARVTATGGELASLTTPEEARLHWYPQILPGGRAVLFTASDPGPDAGDVMVLDLATGESRTVVAGGVAGHYTPTGHLVFLRGGDLWAVGFDLATLTVQGQPALVEQGIRVEPGGAVQFALAEDGGLAYLSETGVDPFTFVWVSRDGREEPVAAAPAAYQEFTLSPDGTRVAVRISGAPAAVWIYDLVRDTSTRLTFESDQVGASFPTWTPDGTRVAFGGPLSWKRADGIGGVERLDDAPQRRPQAFSPDGATLVFRDQAGEGGLGLGVLTLEGDRTATLVINGEFAERNAARSPDGRWVAYQSNEAGQYQVYVQSFPGVDSGRWQISTDGGEWPVWNPAGGELFYRTPTGVMALAFETEPTFTPGALTQLFERIIIGARNRRMAVSPDGQRFLLLANAQEGPGSEAARSQLIVVQNWFEELKRLVPTN